MHLSRSASHFLRRCEPNQVRRVEEVLQRTPVRTPWISGQPSSNVRVSKGQELTANSTVQVDHAQGRYRFAWHCFRPKYADGCCPDYRRRRRTRFPSPFMSPKPAMFETARVFVELLFVQARLCRPGMVPNQMPSFMVVTISCPVP